MPKVSLLIPLYRSSRFNRVICANIREALKLDAEVILSDRHGNSDFTNHLRQQFPDKRVRILSAGDESNWVQNINHLMLAAQGDYFRILPHDDSTTAQETSRLADALDAHSDAFLAYGSVTAIDLSCAPLPARDCIHPAQDQPDNAWTPDHILPLFWKGLYGGAFKALIRRDPVVSHQLWIKETQRLMHSERAWLFALGWLGRFHLVPGNMLTKRFFASSTSAQWNSTELDLVSTCKVMQAYARDLIPDHALQQHVQEDLSNNLRLALGDSR
ncbi:glycosyltransferase [Thalassobius sp. MITS945101]|uniref:glycosyltransferase n=2 Tax=Thalassobius sp. MITS945101 TaxID=3096994 RepID=UPI00399B02A2